MSLYDDFDKHRASDKVAGWSSGIKLLQSQLQLKKAATTQPKRDQYRKATAVLPPVIDLKSKTTVIRENDQDDSNPTSIFPTAVPNNTATSGEFDWNVVNEYDPLWPNEYDKVVKELRDIKDREYDQEAESRKRRRELTRFEESTTGSTTMIAPERDEERSSTSRSVAGGAAIAPPPSLQESSESLSPSAVASPNAPSPVARPGAGLGYATSSVAAKIMAKYGFKEGQGLGKKEQGMSVALQVEKTSKRGGRIVGEREQLMPPPPPLVPSPPSGGQGQNEEPSITEIMKSPSKVVLLRNMVGPGEVDDDLEPEVKDECNTKYGDVNRVVIQEVQDVQAEEAVRIFVEFKRIESAIKAVVDLNGRFFGGRQAVLLRNMVGPGEVDDDLEPEVEDECNTKYGDVNRVVIQEIQDVPAEEAVRIFVEFKRIESAIKAVVDLNGRFFGGRQVKAGFYSSEKLDNFQLMDQLYDN